MNISKNNYATGFSQSPSFIQRTQISSAQLKDLVAHPVTLVPAPGVGKVLAIQKVMEDYKSGATGYTIFDSVKYFWGPNKQQIVVELDGTISEFVPTNTLNSLLENRQQRVDVENAAFTLGIDGSADLTDGDGTLTVTVEFRIVDLS